MNARLMGRPARAAAAVLGALVAAGAVTLVAMAGTANAAGAGRCIDNVNVRAQPDISSEIVAVCERGQSVQIGETRDGFVELTDLKGWAAQEYVSANGHVGSAPTTPRTTSAKPTPTATNGHSTSHHRNPALNDPFADDADGTDGTDTTSDSAAATATPTADADADGTDAAATDAGATDTAATGTDPAATPTTQASQPASPLGGLGGLLG